MAPRFDHRRWWDQPGGGRELLAVAYPLILSNMSFTVQISVDRMFLTWYSREAVAGAVASLFIVWTLIGLFIATGEYLTTFVGQYHGAGRPRRIGPAIWQGIYFSIVTGALCAALSPFLGPVFDAAGHDPAVRVHEVTYSRMLMLGAFPVILMATLASFFAGRGKTRTVLVVNVLSTLVNVVLDYCWIFGHAGFPRAGVAGAALATIVSQAFGAAVYLALILRRRPRETFATLTGWRPEPALLLRLLRYGLPSGLQFACEVGAFGIFMVIVGRLGTDALAATGIAFNLNAIVFVPMLGLALAVSSLVARHLGGNDALAAERVVWSALALSMVYMTLCGLAYLLLPQVLLGPYAAGADPRTFAPVAHIATMLLRFVAIYSIFDMMNVVFGAGLKGAGDTTYPVAAVIVLSWTVMIVPAYVGCTFFGRGIYFAWSAASGYVFCVGLLLMRRFRQGRWKAMRVIEAPPVQLEQAAPA
jgi:MATE family multidrug resistance protein